MQAIVAWLRRLLTPNRVVAEHLAGFEKWLLALPLSQARPMATRALAIPGHFRLPSRSEDQFLRADVLPNSAREFFSAFPAAEGGGMRIDVTAIAPRIEPVGSFTIGSDVEAEIVLLGDGTVVAVDHVRSGPCTDELAYPSIWHYLLEVDAFTWPSDSEARRAAAV